MNGTPTRKASPRAPTIVRAKPARGLRTVGIVPPDPAKPYVGHFNVPMRVSEADNQALMPRFLQSG